MYKVYSSTMFLLLTFCILISPSFETGLWTQMSHLPEIAGAGAHQHLTAGWEVDSVAQCFSTLSVTPCLCHSLSKSSSAMI